MLQATDQDFFLAKYAFSSNAFKNKEEKMDNIIYSDPLALLENNYIIYPNPALNKLNIKLSSEIELENIKIYNLQGIQMISKNFYSSSNNCYTIDIEALKPGIYYIQMDNFFSKPFIKQ